MLGALIVGKSPAYIDLLLSSPDGRRQVAVNVRGKASRRTRGGGLRDADRMTAPQAMGYDVASPDTQTDIG